VTISESCELMIAPEMQLRGAAFNALITTNIEIGLKIETKLKTGGRIGALTGFATIRSVGQNR
jgi:hypothetical protein